MVDKTLQINANPWEGPLPSYPEIEMPPDSMMLVMRPAIEQTILRKSETNAVNRPDHGILVAAGADVKIPLGTEVIVPIGGGVTLAEFAWRDWKHADQVRMFGPVYCLQARTKRRPWYDYAMGSITLGSGLKVKPLYSRLLVERVDMPEVTASGLHVPLNACQRQTFCRILAKPDKNSLPDSLAPLMDEVNEGDVWYYSALGSERPLYWMLDEASENKKIAIIEVSQLLCKMN
jgi:co-chaperonin GroES (HSP10)